jgi:hypothetical protein
MPLREDGAGADRAVGLFRLPLERARSSWNYFHTNDKRMALHAQTIAAHMRKVAHDTNASLPGSGTLLNQEDTLRMLAFLGMASHSVQARMLYPTAGRSQSSQPSQMAVLADRVERMAFVGLTECFNESAEIFLRKYHVNRSRLPALTAHTLKRTDVTKTSREAETIAAQERLLRQVGYQDPLDDFVYTAAAARFHKERESFHVPIVSPQCDATRPEVLRLPENISTWNAFLRTFMGER